MGVANCVLQVIRKTGLKLFVRELFEYVFIVVVYAGLRMLFMFKHRRLETVLLVEPEGIGDLVIFSTVLPDIRMSYSDKKIVLVVRQEAKELFEYCPYVDEVIGIDYERYLNNLLYRMKVLNSLMSLSPEIAFYPSHTRGYVGEQLTILSGAKYKYAVMHLKRYRYNILYTTLVPVSAKLPEIDKYRNFFAEVGRSSDKIHPTELWFSEQDYDVVNTLLQEHGIEDKQFIILFPGARYGIRCWQTSNFLELINQIAKDFPKLVFVVAGAEKDKVHYERMRSELNPILEERFLDFTGKTNLRELGILLNRATVYIGAETSALHMAVAVGTPTVCIMGGGHFGRFFPYGDLKKNRIVYHHMDCYGCNWRCIYNGAMNDGAQCIRRINVDDVYNEFKSLWGLRHHERPFIIR